MLKSIFIFLVSIVGLPLYAICVILLLAVGVIFGITYVDSSVYVCEYIQPIFTAVVALTFLTLALRKIWFTIQKKRWCKLTILSVLSFIYIYEIRQCILEFCNRLSIYSGMTNRQIFDFVVKKLRDMGEFYPYMNIHLPSGESITYGYIMANMEVYIFPLSIVLLCGFIQWRLSKRIKHR